MKIRFSKCKDPPWYGVSPHDTLWLSNLKLKGQEEGPWKGQKAAQKVKCQVEGKSMTLWPRQKIFESRFSSHPPKPLCPF